MMRETVIAPNGDVIYRVSREKYLKSEGVRNYILRSEYENGDSRRWATIKAMKKFSVTKGFCVVAIREYKHWYYGLGVRHRPIEYYIDMDKRKRMMKNIPF